MTTKRTAVDLDHLRRLYKQGTSVFEMARTLSVSRVTVVSRLKDLGLPIRNGTQANDLRFARMTTNERRNLTRIANIARRKQPISTAEPADWINGRATKAAMAQSRTVGNGETELFDLLISRGLNPIPQHPVGRYNVDIALSPVAVEVWWGNAYPFRVNRFVNRTVNLANLGWNTIYVWCSHIVPDEGAAQEVISFYDHVRGNPQTIRPQYRVIRSNGDTVASGQSDFYDITTEPPFSGKP